MLTREQRDALAGFFEWATRKPDDQFRYSRCKVCDASWWEREEHRSDCLLVKAREALRALDAAAPSKALASQPQVDARDARGAARWKAAYERANAEVFRLADLLRKADPTWGAPMHLNTAMKEAKGG